MLPTRSLLRNKQKLRNGSKLPMHLLFFVPISFSFTLKDILMDSIFLSSQVLDSSIVLGVVSICSINFLFQILLLLHNIILLLLPITKGFRYKFYDGFTLIIFNKAKSSLSYSTLATSTIY